MTPPPSALASPREAPTSHVTEGDLLDLVDELVDADAPSGVEPDEPPTRRGWWRPVALALATALVLTASGVAVWTARGQAAAADLAVTTSRLSDAYQDALYAATVEQSLERAVTISQDATLRTWHTQAGDAVERALDEVSTVGARPDEATVRRARELHATYVAAVPAALAGEPAADQRAVQASEDLQDLLSGAAQGVYADAEQVRQRVAAGARTTVSAQTVAIGVLLLVLLLTSGTAFAWWRRLRQEESRSRHQALHDELTGLPNRLVLQDRLEQALIAARRGGFDAALVVLDIDRFKEINDSLGHDYGDLLLQQLGPRLRQELRESDTIARLGGDEFGIVLPQVTGVDAALLVAEKLRRAIEEPFVVNGMSLAIEASVGVAVAPDHGSDVRTLLQRADIAMYLAKDNQVGVSGYDSSVDGHTPARAALLGDLRRAIAERELSLHFQPKCTLDGRELRGVEALVRWQHPTQGLLPPDAFVPLAERTGLVHPLTRFVLDAALSQCRTWLDEGLERSVAVNLSTRTLLDRGFAQDVRRLLHYWQLPARLLTLEITESALMGDPVRATELLTELAEMGVRLSIDDFGTGYSSLSSLRMLPVHELKIDRSFVRDMLQREADASIVRAIVDLGHTLGLTVVAEGIEDEATAAELERLGCDLGQGYFLGAPTTARRLNKAFGGGSDAWLPRPSLPGDVR